MTRPSIIVALLLLAGCASQSASPAPSASVPADARELGGIQYQEMAIGTGEEMSPRRCVYTHYTGWLADGAKFESSRDTMGNGVKGEPVAFPQGVKRVIDGWDVGFTGMRVGGTRRLFVPYQLGYGEKGNPPSIPRRADLIFEVELMALAVPIRRDEAFSSRSAPECPPWRQLQKR